MCIPEELLHVGEGSSDTHCFIFGSPGERELTEGPGTERDWDSSPSTPGMDVQKVGSDSVLGYGIAIRCPAEPQVRVRLDLTLAPSRSNIFCPY